jgi:phosphohistidine phosphatase
VRRLLPRLDVVGTSPLARAVETGEILAAAFEGASVERLDALAPDAAPEALLAWLRRHPRDHAVAIVGHEPGLGSLVALLCAGRPAPFIELRKGGACLLAVSRRVRPGTATLRWLLTAGQLRRVGR